MDALPPSEVRTPTRPTAPVPCRPLRLAVSFVIVISISVTGGCALFGKKSPVPEDVAACRELSRRGIAALEMGNWGEAEILLREALQASPDDPETRRYLAEALWRRGAVDEALREISAAVAIDKSDAVLLVRSGEMLFASGDRKAALEHAEEAIGLEPRMAGAWALRGRIHWKNGSSDAALADLQRALQYSPNNSEVLLDLAALYRERGEAARSLTTIHHLLETYPPGDEPQLAYLLEGLALTELRRTQQAVESFAMANQRGPRNAEVMYRLAEAQLTAGNAAAAAAAAQEGLAIDSRHEPCRRLAAQLADRAAPSSSTRR